MNNQIKQKHHRFYNSVIYYNVNIFKDKKENTVLLIDGHWGIGKTYLVNNSLDKQEYEVKYVSVFGLDNLKSIEQVSKIFNIIIIANLYKFNDEEKHVFNEYKEKILDYVFELKRINNDIFEDLINEIRIEKNMNCIDKNERIRLIKIYTCASKSPNDFEKINNIRIYKKYINLVFKLENYLFDEIGDKFSKLNNDYIEACKEVIFAYYDISFSKKENSFDKEIKKKEILQLFLCKDLSNFLVEEYLETYMNLDIKKDISSLWGIYSMVEEEYEKLIKKIENKIQNRDIRYFINPKNVISLFDVFVNLKIDEKYRNNLLFVVDEIISESNFGKKNYNSDEWDDIDYIRRTECNSKTKAFINDINKKMEIEDKKIIKKNYENAIAQKDIKKIENFFSFKIINNECDFSKIFDFAFNDWIKTNKKEYLLFIGKLISNTETNIVEEYLKEKRKGINNFLIQKKYEHFEKILEEKAYMEYQAESFDDSIFKDM